MQVKQEFLTPNKYSRPGMALHATHVAWHYVGNPGSSAEANRNYFESNKDRHKYVSAHYIVGLNGEVIQCIPENEWSYCTNQANSYAISIECCHPDASGKFTAATEQSLVELTADILRRIGQPTDHIIRHHDVTGKDCPRWYVSHPDDYNAARGRVAAILGGQAPQPTPAPSPAPQPSNVSAIYRVRTQAHGWLPEVTDLSDYAGYQDSPITDVAVRVTAGGVKYRVHVKGGSWLPYVTGYDTNDHNNGYAGNGKPIDAVEVYYSTPDGIRPYKRAKYRVAPVGGSYYSWQYDNETGGGQDGYAGAFGKVIGKFQMCVE